MHVNKTVLLYFKVPIKYKQKIAEVFVLEMG